MHKAYRSILIGSFFFSVYLYPLTIQAEVYKWTDENGKVHFSDQQPSTQSEIVNTENANTYSSKEVFGGNPEEIIQKRKAAYEKSKQKTEPEVEGKKEDHNTPD